MFKNVTINLTGPICNCETYNLTWSIWMDEKNRPGLAIICKSCKTKLFVQNEKFLGYLILEKGYPGDPAVNNEVTKEKGWCSKDDGKFLNGLGVSTD